MRSQCPVCRHASFLQGVIQENPAVNDHCKMTWQSVTELRCACIWTPNEKTGPPPQCCSRLFTALARDGGTTSCGGKKEEELTEPGAVQKLLDELFQTVEDETLFCRLCGILQMSRMMVLAHLPQPPFCMHMLLAWSPHSQGSLALCQIQPLCGTGVIKLCRLHGVGVG